MIINVRGTSGSGKSTLAKAVMSRYGELESMYGLVDTPGTNRARPDCIHLFRPGGRPLCVVGHYEVPSGGVDRFLANGKRNFDDVYAFVRRAHADGFDVLYEGLLIMSDTKRCVQLHRDGLPLMVVMLDVPLDVCIAGIQSRRDARGDVRVINPANTESKAKLTMKQMRELTEAGIDARLLSREAAIDACVSLLGLGHPTEQVIRRQEFTLLP